MPEDSAFKKIFKKKGLLELIQPLEEGKQVKITEKQAKELLRVIVDYVTGETVSSEVVSGLLKSTIESAHLGPDLACNYLHKKIIKKQAREMLKIALLGVNKEFVEKIEGEIEKVEGLLSDCCQMMGDFNDKKFGDNSVSIYFEKKKFSDYINKISNEYDANGAVLRLMATSEQNFANARDLCRNSSEATFENYPQFAAEIVHYCTAAMVGFRCFKKTAKHAMVLCKGLVNSAMTEADKDKCQKLVTKQQFNLFNYVTKVKEVLNECVKAV